MTLLKKIQMKKNHI